MRTLLVASQKGGVGKTTTAVNLAALAAAAGHRVLLVDADPLGSVAASLHLSRAGGDGKPAPRPDGVTRKGAVWANVRPNLDVVCPYPDGETGDEHLREFMAGLPASPVPRFYDHIIIDAPPMLGPRPKALLKAAEEVLVVLRAEPMSFRTLPAYLELMQEVRTEGGACRLRGILLTLPAGVRAGGKTEAKLREKCRGLLPVTIPHDAEVNRALVLGEPVAMLAPDAEVSKQYRKLAAVVGLTRDAVPAEPATVPAKARTARAGGTAVIDAETSVGTLTPPPVRRLEGPKPVAKANPLKLPEYNSDGSGGNAALWTAVAAVALAAVAAGVGYFAFAK